MKEQVTMNDIKNWMPLDKMESADEAMYKERVEGAYEVKLPHRNLVLLPYVGLPEIVDYTYPELIALCPVTFFPDIYTLKIKIIPDKIIPELKSLKYYYMDYYDVPISHEHLASKIYAEIRDQVNPLEMSLELVANVRGGIISTVKIGNIL